MPKLVKGGKHVYGWSLVGENGRIMVPEEALADYNFETPSKVILMAGSRRSGGFALTTSSLIRNSRLSVLLYEDSRLFGYKLCEGETVTIGGKPFCWVELKSDGCIIVPLAAMKEYGVNPGDLLLSVRGSRFALAFCVKGPLIDEARRHSNLSLFKCQLNTFCVKSIRVRCLYTWIEGFVVEGLFLSRV